MWPFRKLTAEQIEDREWRKYRDRLYNEAITLRHRPFPSHEAAWEWANEYVRAARAEQEKQRVADNLMSNWSDAHTRSQNYAVDAHKSLANGEELVAKRLFGLAADEERAALSFVRDDKARTYGITAVSAASLYFKAGDTNGVREVAKMALATSFLPAFAADQLNQLLEDIA